MDSSEPRSPPKDLAAERTRELERALQDAVDYLRRLTPVPVTVAKAAQLEAVLRGAAVLRERSHSIGTYSSAGIPLLSAEFIGAWLHLKSPVRSDRDALDGKLIGYLRKGVRLQCQRRADYAPFSELELAYWEAHPRGHTPTSAR